MVKQNTSFLISLLFGLLFLKFGCLFDGLTFRVFAKVALF